MTSKFNFCFVCLLALHLLAGGAQSQWTNRYPKVANFSHHVYLEGYNLPTLNVGATDPAPSPDGRSLAVAARGWLWSIDLTTREARRLTRGGAVDSRPAWSPDGKQLAFVRDDGKDTSIVLLDMTGGASGRERVIVDTPALDLDPAFSRDGRAIFYSSAESGDLDLWRIEISTGAKKRLTTDRGLELQPQPLPGDAQLLYVAKVGAIDSITIIDLRDNSRRVLREEGIASQLRPALKPDGRSLVANLPAQDRWQLWLMDTKGGVPVQVAHSALYPLTPAWSPDDAYIYYVEPDDAERFHVLRIPATGGEPEDVSPLTWNWGEPTTRVLIKTRRAGEATNLPARLSIVDRNGHPLLPDAGQPRFDGQNGVVFFYSPGATTIEVPVGEVRVVATHGFGSTQASATRRIRTNETTIDLEIPASLWNPASEGWRSADLHSHLNYGGPYLLNPDDIVLDMRAEALDLSTPQLANLHTRFIDAEWWNWRRTNEPPMIHFAQEVRSHFLGHVAAIGADSLYWPWYYGPGYPVYDRSDLPNAAALQFARNHGGINSYVHPVSNRNPFPPNGTPTGLPLELVPDALLGDVDTLEVACLWSDELGTSEAWYRLLNLGLPIAPSAGSDTMHNFYRTMAIGSTRVYAKPEGAMNLTGFLAAVRRGRSFVTNGPMIKFTVNDVEAGGVVNASQNQAVGWKLDAWSSVPVEKVEILVNGQVVWSGNGLETSGHKTFNGRLDAPRGGWIAARIYGGATKWPVMDSYPFAHTAPVWFGHVGSSDADAARRAAQDLLRWMDVAEKRLNEGYAGAPAEKLQRRFADARRILETRVR
ncbi:MAG: CehA/McbA family metallohydrolase [Pyrinomonadaceae bacterium]|nr:CehA/McbA family metallohydrolase [Pyrinomonadaceae bacterium]